MWLNRELHGTLAERNTYVLSGDDDVVHWPDLDEDIELTRLLEGGPSAEGPVSLGVGLRSVNVAPRIRERANGCGNM